MKKYFALLSLLLALPACEMYSESHVSDRRVQVREEKSTQEISTSQLNKNYIAALGQDYNQNGKGPVEVVITYDPKSRTNTAMQAGDEAARIATLMHKEGIADVKTTILPVREEGMESKALISYSSYQAAAPAGCGVMQGFENRVLETDPDYKLGCTVETVFARQISDPSDLLGDVKANAYSDGRVSANVVDIYRQGAQNKPLKVEGASE